MMAKLYIIAGHGAGDSGAVGGGQTEADTVRKLAARVKALGGSEVEVLDTSRNWYADKGISTLNLPKGAMLLELHRDSANDASARGAHVIIKDGYNADAFDKALAQKLSAIFPGRSNIIVGRSDLGNVNRAAARGINYRLAEVGFISNATDRQIFDSRMDDIAKAILEAAGIKASSTTTSSAKRAQLYSTNGTDAQSFKPQWNSDGTVTLINTKYNLALDVSGGKTANGTVVQAYKPNGTAAQKWKLVQATTGYRPAGAAPFKIVSALDPKKVLDVDGGKDANGTKLQLYSDNGTQAQQWYIFDQGNGTWNIINNGKGAKKAIDIAAS